ncbi:hypothetical protein [Tenacibaculum xiamenense]|uniref:hypothetical protein n=1 Tax=Tenacibaculum xiamenense TaxID=1261553 RepID=UPI0038960A63
MLNLNCEIIIYEVTKKGKRTQNQISIDFVNSLEIESSWREFTDTASITLPRLIDPDIKDWESQDKSFRQHLNLWAKYHPHIEIYLGYQGRRNLAFKGIIRDVKGGVPVTLICEDDMYHFKTKMISYSNKNASLKSIVESFGSITNAKGETIGIDCKEGINLGTFITEKPMTPVKVLEKLKDDYGIYSFIRYDKEHYSHLVIGKEYEVNHGSTIEDIKTKFGGNFIFYNNIIEDDLIYKYEEDINVKVSYVAKGADENDQVKVTYPDDDQKTRIDFSGIYGGVLSGLFNNIHIKESTVEKDLSESAEELVFYTFEHNLKERKKNKNELKELKSKLLNMAKRRLELIKHDGFSGSFTSFGDILIEDDDPRNNIGGFVRHGDHIQLQEQNKTSIIGKVLSKQMYFVDGVTYSFGIDGFRQKIVLGRTKIETNKKG